MYQKKFWFSVAFLAPAFVLYTVFIILPVLSSTYYSFTEWNGAKAPVFAGLDNYTKLVNDSNYWQVVRNTLALVVYTVVFQISLGLLFAYLLFWTTAAFVSSARSISCRWSSPRWRLASCFPCSTTATWGP